MNTSPNSTGNSEVIKGGDQETGDKIETMINRTTRLTELRPKRLSGEIVGIMVEGDRVTQKNATITKTTGIDIEKGTGQRVGAKGTQRQIDMRKKFELCTRE